MRIVLDTNVLLISILKDIDFPRLSVIRVDEFLQMVNSQ